MPATSPLFILAAIWPALLVTACASATPDLPRADGATLAAACAEQDDRKSWDVPAPPSKIHGSTYYVGTCGISAVLIDTPDGLILIDAATQKGGPAVAASIRALGFDPTAIRLLLTTHEHMDHAGGLAFIQRLSGAPLRALPHAIPALSTGKPSLDDPQHDMLDDMEPVQLGDALSDGVPLDFGGITLTPYATPAHTIGSTSFTWKSCDSSSDNACVTIAFMDSLSTPAPNGYKFSQRSDQRARVESGLAKARSLTCNLLITPHPSASGLMDRLAGHSPLVQNSACTDYAATATKNFEHRLLKETQ